MNTKFQPLSLLVLALALPLPLLVPAASAATDVRNAPGKGPVVAPQSPPAVVQPGASNSAASTTPATAVTPTKITSITVSSTQLQPGMSFVVKVNGLGLPKNCNTSLVIDRLQPELKANYANLATAYQSSAWPRQNTFTLTEEGTYQVRLLPASGSACGYGGEGSIPGDLTKVVVTPAIAK